MSFHVRTLPVHDSAALSASAADFAVFQQSVVGDEALHAELIALTDPELMAARAIERGAERGLHFSGEDVRAALKAARRAWIERHIA